MRGGFIGLWQRLKAALVYFLSFFADDFESLDFESLDLESVDFESDFCDFSDFSDFSDLEAELSPEPSPDGAEELLPP